MQTIIPAILETNFDEIKRKFDLVKNECELVQIDVCDGKFVSSKTFEDVTKFLEFKEKVQLDVMVKNSNAEELLGCGFQSVIFHVNSFDKLDSYFHGNGGHFGFAFASDFGTDGNFENHRDLISKADFVQVMGINHIGKQREPFDFACLETIKKIRAEFSDLVIQVDGGMNETTIPLVLAAGANRAVVGSAIFGKGNPVENFKNLEEIARKSVSSVKSV